MKKGSINPHLWKARIGECLKCKVKFRAIKDWKKRKQKYCSSICYQKAWGTVVRPKMRNNPGLKNDKNPAWKGDRAGYHAIHKWIIRKLGTPQKCENCGDDSNRKYEWANKDHKYRRNLSDWMRLCTPCHRAHDGRRSR